jgi:serine/threonine-protein kinase HipA
MDSEDSLASPSFVKLSADDLEALSQRSYSVSADLSARSRLSLAGSQAKAGLYQTPGDETTWYLPVGSAPSTHIVKPANGRFPELIFNEAICLMTARQCGIQVPEIGIINTEQPMLAIRRFDRMMAGPETNLASASGLAMPLRLHQEDLCQALGRLSSEKYETEDSQHLALVANLLRTHSSEPINDLRALGQSIIFNYLAGNCDNHIKNLSLVRSPDLMELRLAPCYDLICTAVYPELSRDMGFHIGTKLRIDTVRRSDFVKMASVLTVDKTDLLEDLDTIAETFPPALQNAIEALSTQGFADAEAMGESILANAQTRLATTIL